MMACEGTRIATSEGHGTHRNRLIRPTVMLHILHLFHTLHSPYLTLFALRLTASLLRF